MSRLSFQKQNLAERVADQLSQAIGQQGWGAGHRLPPVRNLAKQFKVSPNTAHSAIRLLAKRGIIDLKPRGSFIQRESSAIKRKQIGIISTGGTTPYIPPLTADYFTRDWCGMILGGMQETMAKAGKLMTIIPSHLFDEDPLAALLERIDGVLDSLAGIICFSLNWPLKLQADLRMALEQRGTPYVTINRFSDLNHHNFVSVDFIGGTRLVGRCLARMGLTKVLLLVTEHLERSHSGIEQVGGLFQGFALEKICTHDINVRYCANHQKTTGHELMLQYLDKQPAPQAVVAMGDLIALGAIQALGERGLRVPEDVGVIGGTGMPQLRDAKPSLTTLSQPMSEIGRQAIQMLLEMERADITRLTGRTVPGKLAIRQSLAIPKSIQMELAEELETWTFETES